MSSTYRGKRQARYPGMPLHKETHTRINLYVESALWQKFTEDCVVLDESPSVVFQSTMRKFIRERSPEVRARLLAQLGEVNDGN
jgi:hypothetical protein